MNPKELPLCHTIRIPLERELDEEGEQDYDSNPDDEDEE